MNMVKKVTEELYRGSKRYPIRKHKLSMKVHRLPLGNRILTPSVPYIARWPKTPYHSAWVSLLESGHLSHLGAAPTLHFRPHATVEVSTASRRKEATMRDWICFIETFYAESWFLRSVVRILIAMTQPSLRRLTAEVLALSTAG